MSAVQGGIAVALLRARPDSLVDAVGRRGRGIPGASANPDHPAGFRAHELHVVHGGADVLRGDVAPAQRLHRAAVGPKEPLPVAGAFIRQDDGLAPSQIQAGDGRLVGHAAREAQGVGQGVRLAGVPPQAGAAQSRTQRRVVDGDDAPVARRGLRPECQLIVAEGRHLLEYLHAQYPLVLSCSPSRATAGAGAGHPVATVAPNPRAAMMRSTSPVASQMPVPLASRISFSTG